MIYTYGLLHKKKFHDIAIFLETYANFECNINFKDMQLNDEELDYRSDTLNRVILETKHIVEYKNHRNWVQIWFIFLG